MIALGHLLLFLARFDRQFCGHLYGVAIFRLLMIMGDWMPLIAVDLLYLNRYNIFLIGLLSFCCTCFFSAPLSMKLAYFNAPLARAHISLLSVLEAGSVDFVRLFRSLQVKKNRRILTKLLMSIRTFLHFVANYGGDLAGDLTDQFHTMVTTNILLAAASIVAGKSFLGSPFQVVFSSLLNLLFSCHRFSIKKWRQNCQLNSKFPKASNENAAF